ncbi:MAG TPA: hypothetical protein VGF52_06725 [Tepidisphaeraceae bacterium]|jgi:hypothetical protein
MRVSRNFLLVGLAILPRLAAADVTITRSQAVIEHRVFDPNNPPADMPKLAGDEAALTESYFSANSSVGGSVVDQQKTDNGCRTSIKVDTVQMTLRLRVTVWLPTNAVPKIVNHEEGHRAIAEYFYRDADAAARRVAEELIGQTISGSGSDCDAAGQNATKQAAQILGARYMGAVDVPCGKAQELYDQITEHGTNAVKEEKAIKQAIQGIDK